MPYETNEDLPSSVAGHLPPHAQDIYRAAFNNAWAAHVGDPRQEEAAHRIAWEPYRTPGNRMPSAMRAALRNRCRRWHGRSPLVHSRCR